MNQRNQSAKDFANTLDPKVYDDYIVWAKTEIREYEELIEAIKNLKQK